MNDKNDDLNKTNHHSPLASNNDNEKLIIKDEILKINDLIKDKFHLPKLDQNIKDKFLVIKKSTFELKNDFQDQSLKISSSIKKQEDEIYNLSETNNIKSDILENQKILIETYKNNKNQLQSYTLKLEKKLAEQKSSNRNFLANNTELKSTVSRFIKHNKNLQNDINRLKQAQSDSLIHKSRIEEMSNQIKFYQEDNVRLSNEIINIQKKYEMIGKSPSITHIKEMIEKVAPSDARVLITGANGSGKELVAHWLHEKSLRNKGPLIEVNCAAIPSELIESELFGHKKGSFTGASKDRAGKFETANNGTLFLDEIGDMSLSAQAKVLRALQESEISRVGSDQNIKVNVRVIAATNKDLQKEISEGNFREDLYHRLAVILIKVPLLNERRQDIPLLIQHFSKKISEEQGTVSKEFSKNAITMLQKYDWTGNIRELRNVIERLIILSGEQVSENDVKLFASK